MPRATWAQTNFNGGEWSPLTYGRFDLAKYKNGLADCTNYMPTQQGGLTRRPGTRFIAATKDTSYPVRLQKFEFSITQAYVLEFGNLYIRFYTNDGQLQTSGVAAYNAGTAYNPGDLVTNGGVTYYCIAATTGNAPPNATYWYAQSGTIYEIPTVYTSTDIWNLGFTQKADVIYITLPTQPPYKLQRKGATNWALTVVTFLDGPYLGLNTTQTTLTPSNTIGTSSLVASSTAGINGGAGFRASDVGRLVRVRCVGNWVWGVIASVANSTLATWTVTAYQGPGVPSQATATSTVTAGVVTGLTLVNGGSGYGTGVPVIVSIATNNTDPARGSIKTYNNPRNPDPNAQGGIASVAVTYSGSGYTAAPTVVVNTSTGGGAVLQAVMDSTGAKVVSVTVVQKGAGYMDSDTISFVGGVSGGSGAAATATVTNGSVSGLTLTSGGSGYTVAPSVIISAPAGVGVLPTTFWRLGVWNATDGYPTTSVFHQDRLVFSGATSIPNRVDASNVGDYENFAPTQFDGTITDANAFSFNLSAGGVNAAQWLASDENGLLIGTAGGEWLITPSTTQQAITPTNVNSRLMSGYGSTSVPPVRLGKATLFVQRTQRKLRELFFQFYGNTFLANDISLVGEHLTASGIKQMGAQLAPQQVIWFVLNNGRLTAATYDKDQDVNGWHKHYLGGFSDVAQTLSPLVDSVCCIPTPSAQRDEVWLAVNRYINGATFRSIELMTKMWEDGDTLPNAVQGLDSSAQYSGAPTSTVTGLTWLKGQTVGVLADGATHPDVVVDNTGAITLTRTASTVQVGLKYISKGKTLPIEAGGADGPSQGKKKRISRAIMRFFQSVGLNIASDDPTVPGGYYPVNFRTSANQMGQPVPLFNGIERISSDTTWVEDGQIAFEQIDPLPSSITMLAGQLETQDGG